MAFIAQEVLIILSVSLLLLLSCLGRAIPRLQAAGVDVGDVRYRGSFAFVIKIGYPNDTFYNKSLDNQPRNTPLVVTING